MNWRSLIPNVVTSLAMLAAFASIVFSAHGQYMLAAQMIMLCLILDGLDGNLARILRGTSKFGAELDTFVDITAYGLAPAMLICELVMPHFGLLGTLLVAWTVLSGALRLSRFRVADPHRGNKGYCGLPITLNASWVALFVFIVHSNIINDARMSLTSGPLATVVWTCSTAFLCLQISNVRYSKPSKTPVLFISGVILVLLLFMKIEVAVASAFAMCAYIFFYSIISPFLPKHDIVMSSDEDEDPMPVRHS